MARPLLLVLRSLGLGDLMTAVPALRGLRRAYPDHELVLAAPARLAPLAFATGAVDRLHRTPGFAGQPVADLGWRDGSPRLAVNLHGRGPQSHRALFATGPRRLLGFACPPAGYLDGPQWIEEEHEVVRWCRLLGWAGIAADPGDLALPTPPTPRHRPDPGRTGQALAATADRGGTALVHPGASGAERRWPARRFSAVARALAADGHRVVVTGTRAEQRIAWGVARTAGLPASAVLAGRTDLSELAAMVAHAALVVCGDTGVAHLATAYGTPSVVLFGPVPPARWGPPPDRLRHVALWHGSDGLRDIAVDEVLAAARNLLGMHRRRIGSRDAAAAR
jgi:ADP-heptose:LPS heptosyltransferase